MRLASQARSSIATWRLAKHLRRSDSDWPFVVREISHDAEQIQRFVDFYNTSGQLTWQLTPERFKRKLGIRGKAYLMTEKQHGKVVGTIALKQVTLGRLQAAEMGYFMLSSDFKGARSLQTALQLSLYPLLAGSRFDCVFGMVKVTDKGVNRLWTWSKYAQFAFDAPSPYSDNRLNYYITLVNNGKYTPNEQIEALKQNLLNPKPQNH